MMMNNNTNNYNINPVHASNPAQANTAQPKKPIAQPPVAGVKYLVTAPLETEQSYQTQNQLFYEKQAQMQSEAATPRRKLSHTAILGHSRHNSQPGSSPKAQIFQPIRHDLNPFHHMHHHQQGNSIPGPIPNAVPKQNPNSMPNQNYAFSSNNNSNYGQQQLQPRQLNGSKTPPLVRKESANTPQTQSQSHAQAQRPNWTALIPPIPKSTPPNANGPEQEGRDEFFFEEKGTNSKNISNPWNPSKSSSESSSSSHLNPNQRHSIAVSPSALNANLDGNDSGKPPLKSYDSTKSVMPEISDQKRLTKRKSKKVCRKCGLDITGQFVRALHNAYHVECFCCHECGNQCSAKFFPFDVVDEATGVKTQVPLCEYDYFKKLDLICFTCHSALRGPYITALGNKYHLEHFKCAVCQKVFESDESYYEHESNIYCHYHYSKLYASHCEGCHSSIVKQFVELFRGGRNQQWHPECYMVHKFWNVCIMADSVGLQSSFNVTENEIANLREIEEKDDFGIDPKLLLSIEQQIENVVMRCWLTLSGYEETTATCISDMLLNACTGNQRQGLLVTGKLILNVEVLFKALDCVLDLCDKSFPLVLDAQKLKPQVGQHADDLESSFNQLEEDFFQPLKKEPRNISGKIMSYLAILRKSNHIAQSGSLSAELLSVITGCAHYLKLLIRIGLNNALKVNKLNGNTIASDKFLELTSSYELYNKKSENLSQDNTFLILSKLAIPPKSTDACMSCTKSIEKSCIKFENKRWHPKCFNCSVCSRFISSEELPDTKFHENGLEIICQLCSSPGEAKVGFEIVSDLSQLVYLLKIAHTRSKAVMKVDFRKQSQTTVEQIQRPTEEAKRQHVAEDNYSKTINDVTRMRTRRQSQKLSNSIKKNARKSVIVEAPEANKAKQDDLAYSNLTDDNIAEELADVSFENNRGADTQFSRSDRNFSASSQLSYVASQRENEHFNVKKSLKIREEPQRQLTNTHLDRTSDLLKNEKSLTLDDIPRIVAAEQARDQRPNAFKHHQTLYQKPNHLQNVRTSPNMISPSSHLDSILTTPVGQGHIEKKQKYYSELTKEEHFIMRHIAVEALGEVAGNKFNKDELLSLIQTKKLPTFWDKFKFGSDKKDKHLGVFGVDLQDLTKKYGIDSDLGVGPSRLRIPIVVDDVISALKQKDMSVEGIFRLNGNIKKLRDLTEQINKSPLKSPDFSIQTAVQLAALMKKWLRELPNPLLTYTLYDMWISSQSFENPVLRKRVLQLTYCMLPRSHRNLLEVLLYFFSWVASFAEIDEETGSKMDIHNLATVIAPNILFSKQNSQADAQPQGGDTYFLAIEVVNQLIDMHEELCVIPDDLLQFFDKCGFVSDNITTKEIMNRVDKVLKENSKYFQNFEIKNPEGISNQEVRSNTISRGQSKAIHESHVEASDV